MFWGGRNLEDKTETGAVVIKRKRRVGIPKEKGEGKRISLKTVQDHWKKRRENVEQHKLKRRSVSGE